MSKFRLHWLDGKKETVEGTDIADAMTHAGYGAGALAALDYYDAWTPPLETEPVTVETKLPDLKVKCEYCDEGKPGRRTIAGHEEQCEFCGGTGEIVEAKQFGWDESLQQLQAGEQVRRLAWSLSILWVRVEGKRLMWHASGVMKPWMPLIDDFDASDWVVVAVGK